MAFIDSSVTRARQHAAGGRKGARITPSVGLVADRGYDTMALVERIEVHGATAHIPTQRDRMTQRSVDRAIYRQRNLVERYFNKLKHFRRIATRFEERAVRTSQPSPAHRPDIG